ncbi:hypothetical protein [Nonomuraea sp. NPDC003214]
MRMSHVVRTYWYETAPGTKIARSVPGADSHRKVAGRVYLMKGEEVRQMVPAGSRWGCTEVSETIR